MCATATLFLIPTGLVFGSFATVVAHRVPRGEGFVVGRSHCPAGGALFLIALAYPRGLGMGDAKLVAVMGLFLGAAVAPAVLVGFATGAVVGAILIARHGAAARKQAVPFGPFLALGGLVGLWAG